MCYIYCYAQHTLRDSTLSIPSSNIYGFTKVIRSSIPIIIGLIFVTYFIK